MIVKKVIPCGFCKGVINAINLAKKTRQENPNENIYVLGMLVHNSHVIEELNDLNIISLDDSKQSKEELLSQIDNGIVIFTAHGISSNIRKLAADKNLTIVDATCQDVLKTHSIIEEYINDGYDVIFYGVKNHPEAVASISISNKIHLVTCIQDIQNLKIENPKIALTSQTTMSANDFDMIINTAKQHFPKIIIEKQICDATSARQEAILNLKDCDCLYVVGDRKSNNTNKLVSIANKINIKKVFLIEDITQINNKDLNKNDKVYVSAGASTPTFLIEEVINYLSSYSFD